MKRHETKIIYSLITTVLLAVILCFVPAAIAAEGAEEQASSFKTAESYLPDDGAYRIKNLANGSFITIASFEDEGEIAALTEEAENSVVFLLTRQADYSYIITADGGNEHLAISREKETPLISLTETDGLSSRFSLMRLDDGSFFISPLSSDNSNLVLCEDSEGQLALSSFMGDVTQCWVLEKLPVTSVAMERETLSLTIGRSATLSVVTYPAVPEEAIVFSSSDESVAVVNDDGLVTAVTNGTTVITATVGSLSSDCTVTVSKISASAFFSQHNTTGGGGWDGSSLQNMRFAGKRFARDGFNSNTDWMDEGCLNCCFAMILKNLGATLDEGYDFRTGDTGDLAPDPYTVALANSGNYGPTDGSARLYGNPVAMDVPRMIARFSAGGAPLTVTHQSGGNQKKIKEALDKHPEGVIVEFYISEEYRHFILFTECVNPEDTPTNYKFIVCDPSAFDRENGDHVLFTDSTSYNTIGYRYRNIRSIKTVSILTEYDYVGSLRGDRIGDSRIK